MSIRDSFTPEDWTHVLAAPMLVGMSISAADPGGLFSAFQESGAVARAVATGASEDGTLIDEVAKSYQVTEDRLGIVEAMKSVVAGKKTSEEVMAAAIGDLDRIFALVSAKVPEQTQGFSDWLLHIAQAVAEAGKEGGFLGFGGVAVSPEETAAIEKLRGALGGATPA